MNNKKVEFHFDDRSQVTVEEAVNLVYLLQMQLTRIYDLWECKPDAMGEVINMVEKKRQIWFTLQGWKDDNQELPDPEIIYNISEEENINSDDMSGEEFDHYFDIDRTH